MLAMLPLCGVFGLCGVMAAFAAGAPVVMLDAFDDALAAALLVRHRITHTFGSDDMFRRIIAHAPGERPFPDARLFGFGAFSSAFNEEAIDAWQRGIPLTGPYGSSEVLALWSMQPHHLPVTQRIEGGGVPVAGKDAVLRIRDVESGMLLPPGQSGEIEIRSPSNFIGYFNNPEASAQAVTEDGFFRTGDLGYLRQDGSLAYQTRMGDAIRLSGFLVDPVEIEEVLRQMPGVAEAQVVGVPIDGQLRPVAFVIARAGMAIQEKALQAEAARRIAAFKVPARIWQVEAYPMTQSANGLKVQRVKLRDWAAERLSAA
jgi:fatty-acyl-CoA synthase